MGITSGPFVSKEGAENLLHYHYQGEDRSFIAKHYYPFWNKVALLFPLRFSPNLISLLGTAFPIAASLYIYTVGYVIASSAWTATNTTITRRTPPPTHAFFLYAFCLFVYQTMDAVDGLQGKRVDMYYNPTTEIFDHGCDSVNMAVSAIMASVGMQIISSKLSIIFVVSSLCTFYWPTWEHLNTGVMIFRGGVLNPTEGLLFSQLMFIITGLFPNIWVKTLYELVGIKLSLNLPFLSSLLGTSHVELGAISINHIVVFTTFTSAVFAGISSISNVITAHRTKSKDPKSAPKSLLGSLAGLLPLISVILCAYLWTEHMSTCSCYQIWRCQPLALMAITIPWNYAIYNIIISEITETKMKVVRILIGQLPMFLPLLPIPLFENWGEQYLLGTSLVVSLSIYLLTVRNALGEVCTVLGMKHFWSIPKFDNPKANEEQKKAHAGVGKARQPNPGKAD